MYILSTDFSVLPITTKSIRRAWPVSRGCSLLHGTSSYHYFFLIGPFSLCFWFVIFLLTFKIWTLLSPHVILIICITTETTIITSWTCCTCAMCSKFIPRNLWQTCWHIIIRTIAHASWWKWSYFFTTYGTMKAFIT